MELLRVLAYAGFGLLSYKIAGVFFYNPLLLILIGISTLSFLFFLIEVVPNRKVRR